MALAAAKTFIDAEILTHTDLNTLNTNILNNANALISPFTGSVDVDGFDLTDIDELEFRDAVADPTADGRLRRNGDTLTFRAQDARTATVARPFAIQADTTGVPAASIGVGMRFDAESADESPSVFGAIDFVATDVTAATEDTDFVVMLRDAGAVIAERFRVNSDGGIISGGSPVGTPAQHALYRENAPKVWVEITVSAGVPSLGDNFNCTGTITDGGIGIYTFTIDRDFANTTYVGNVTTLSGSVTFNIMSARNVGSCEVRSFDAGGTATDNPLGIILMGDQ